MSARHPGTAEPQLGFVKPSAPLGLYSRGYLPHHDELHRLQSITFRLADSFRKQPSTISKNNFVSPRNPAVN